MKLKLITILLLASIGAQAQFTNGTAQKSIAGGEQTILTSGVRDTVPKVTGVLTNGYLLAYNSTSKKWYALNPATLPATPDTTVYRTVANSRSLAQTQTALNLKANLASPEFTGIVKSPRLNVGGSSSTLLSNPQRTFIITPLNSADTTLTAMYLDGNRLNKFYYGSLNGDALTSFNYQGSLMAGGGFSYGRQTVSTSGSSPSTTFIDQNYMAVGQMNSATANYLHMTQTGMYLDNHVLGANVRYNEVTQPGYMGVDTTGKLRLGKNLASAVDNALADASIKIVNEGDAHVTLLSNAKNPSINEIYLDYEDGAGNRVEMSTFGTDNLPSASTVISATNLLRVVKNNSSYPHPNLMEMDMTTGILKLNNYTSNGVVETSGGIGTLAVTATTGTGNVVKATSPTLVTPNLGTPSTLVGTNITGTAAGLTAGNVTTNANLTGAVTSIGNATSLGSFTSANLRSALTDESGTGSAVFQGGDIGAASGTSLGLTGALTSAGVTSSAAIVSQSNFSMQKDGSNSVAAGGYYGWLNAASTRGWLTQLNASNGLDWWYYNGSAWSVKASLDNAGNATFNNIVSGTFTPSLTNGTNISSSTANVGRYQRVGNIVSGDVRISIATTSTGGSVINFSLPVASAMTVADDLSATGTGSYSPIVATQVYGFADTTNDRAQIQFFSSAGSSTDLYIHFSYEVK